MLTNQWLPSTTKDLDQSLSYLELAASNEWLLSMDKTSEINQSLLF
jgi:hypothetical protein